MKFVRLLLATVGIWSSLAAGPNAATYESAALGTKTITLKSGAETYIVTRGLNGEKTYAFFPVSLRLNSAQAAPVSMIVSRSAVFDDQLSFHFSATFEPETTSSGLSELQKALGKEYGGNMPPLSPIGSVRYKLYMYESATSADQSIFNVTKLDEGTATTSSSIAVAFKIDAIDGARLKDLLTNTRERMFMVAVFEYNYEIKYSQSAGQDLPSGALSQLFDSLSNAPLSKLYEKQLAASSPDTVELKLKAIDELAPVIFGSTPAFDISGGKVNWNLSKERLDAIKNSETLTEKRFNVRDVAKTLIRMPSLCEEYQDSIIDVDSLGPFCN